MYLRCHGASGGRASPRVALEQSQQHLGLALALGWVRFGDDVVAEVAGHHFQHQPVHRALGGGDLHQHGVAVVAGFKCLLQGSHLSGDAPHAGEQLLLVTLDVCHVRDIIPLGGI